MHYLNITDKENKDLIAEGLKILPKGLSCQEGKHGGILFYGEKANLEIFLKLVYRSKFINRIVDENGE